MDHIIEAAAPAKYKHIDFKPPEGVRKAAKRGLEMRKEHGRGGTAVGVARARDLMNGKTISPSTARRMKAYFDRHQPDQKAEGFDSGEDGYPSAGRVAWLLWGSDAGYAWAKKLVKQMEAADKKVSGSVVSEWAAVDDLLNRKPDVTLEFHQKGNDAIEIEMFSIPRGRRRQGEGERLYREFEAALPKCIKRIDLYAADTGGGPSHGFWDAMGFDYKYTDEEDESHPKWNELKNWMVKYVRQETSASSIEALADNDQKAMASFKLRTPTGIPGLRDDDDHDSGYGDFTAALFGALSREKVMDLVEMVGVRMLRALAGPALNGSLKRLLPSLTDSFNIGRKVPITEQEVLSLALRQAKDAARMGLSARHKALLSEVKSVLESELRGKELPPGDSSMKVPEATDTVDEMYEHLSRRSVKASPCGCDSGCACSTPQNSSGQPPSDMTISNLKQIVRDASELLGLLHENMELMGWAEDKITQAKVAVDSVKNYVLTDFGHEASEAVVLTVAAAKKPWEEKREPEGKLSKRWRAEAEKRAKKAGRKYPNQVDNMWAKQQQNEARASVAAALLSAADVLSRGGER